MKTDHFMLPKIDWIPNNPNFPVIVYSQIGPNIEPDAFEEMFAANGWTGIWQNGVFGYHHYHSGAHEVLGVGCGHAKLQIGGPEGADVEVSQGDCLILPAGTGHKKLESSPDFQAVGAYPPGQQADIQRSSPTDNTLERIKSLSKPESDPVSGLSGGLNDLWRGN